MGEGGLSASEVGKEIAEHLAHHGATADGRHDRIVTIVEAVLLAVVALLAAGSGFLSSKWNTESRVLLAESATARTRSNEAMLTAMELRNFDSSTFEAWFTAYAAGNERAMQIAERRFRPNFRVAFDAWQATDPGSNPDAAPGPTFVPEYVQPDLKRAATLDATADRRFEAGSKAGETADDYVRATVYLATVLFLVGISGHFRVRGARYMLLGIGSAVLIFSVITLATLPGLP